VTKIQVIAVYAAVAIVFLQGWGSLRTDLDLEDKKSVALALPSKRPGLWPWPHTPGFELPWL